jgi:hypothetical protein
MTFEPPPPPQQGPPSFAVPGAAPRPPRPSTVTLAVGLMVLQILLSVVSAIVPFAMRSALVDAYDKVPTQPGAPKVDPDTQFYLGVGGGACGAVISAIILGVLAFFLLRGANVARIITWVLAGLSLCCSAGGIGVLTLMKNGPDFPASYIATTGVLSGFSFLITIAIIVLLALPVSNAFFKPKQPGQLY